jgi:hypothetical protein
MATSLSSRDRMLTALECREPDYVPCCFSAFSIMRQRCADEREFLDRQLAMGLDVAVDVGFPAVRHDPEVRIVQTTVEEASEPYPILRKEYHTPAGVLSVEVKKTPDWPWGDHVPLFEDYLIPRARKLLITSDDSLEALRYVLGPLTDEDTSRLQEQCGVAKELATERCLLTMACYGMVGDVACWLAGIEPLTLMAIDHPSFVHRFLDIIEEWNTRRMEAVLRQGVDLVVRRAWYEHADVWSPSLYREFLFPGLQRDAAQAHAAGAKFGYLMSCASLPLVEMMVEAGVDVLLGVDPAQDRTMDFAALKQKAGGRMSLWGGVCGYLTVERGTEEEIRQQVRQAISTLAPSRGFILSPVTNVREDNPRVWANLDALIDEWRARRTSKGTRAVTGDSVAPDASPVRRDAACRSRR